MGRVLLCAGLLFGLLITAAEARTLRYEFDVVASTIDYQRLQDVSGNPLYPGTAAHEAFVAAHHPLRDMVGQTGSIAFELVQDSSDFRGPFTCISGFLCPAITSFHYVLATDTGFTALGHFEWRLDGELSFLDDGGIGGWAELNGIDHFWWAPRATFTLANPTITDVTGQTTPVPLPASAWFFAPLGLLLFRRRTRA